LEEALRALLTGYAPLTALVAQRIYWNAIPQDAVDPCVVLYKITGAPGYHMQGSDDLEAGIVQIDVRAINTTSMWAVARAIRAKLSGHKDSNFDGIFLRSERQTSEKPATVLYHRASMDFDVWFLA
jgi:hypothetical protein